ncbi:MAG TPA: PGPGW domain-containing protein [Candidatus Polarisedimenticolia bacterium]
MNPGETKYPKGRLVWKIVSITLGSLLILGGIAAGFMPFIPGWIMIFAGLGLLSPHSVWARQLLAWLKEKLHIQRKAPM